jgi:hypothetical protein
VNGAQPGKADRKPVQPAVENRQLRHCGRI